MDFCGISAWKANCLYLISCPIFGMPNFDPRSIGSSSKAEQLFLAAFATVPWRWVNTGGSSCLWSTANMRAFPCSLCVVFTISMVSFTAVWLLACLVFVSLTTSAYRAFCHDVCADRGLGFAVDSMVQSRHEDSGQPRSSQCRSSGQVLQWSWAERVGTGHGEADRHWRSIFHLGAGSEGSCGARHEGSWVEQQQWWRHAHVGAPRRSGLHDRSGTHQVRGGDGQEEDRGGARDEGKTGVFQAFPSKLPGNVFAKTPGIFGWWPACWICWVEKNLELLTSDRWRRWRWYPSTAARGFHLLFSEEGLSNKIKFINKNSLENGLPDPWRNWGEMLKAIRIWNSCIIIRRAY